MKLKHLGLLYLFLSLTACMGVAPPKLHVPPAEPQVSPRIANLHPRVVLVLGGGGARGFAHAGVIKVLEKNHIPIDLIVGTSAGSIVGALYADQAQAGPLIDLLKKTNRENVIDFSFFQIGRGPISGNRLQNFLVQNMRARDFSQLKIPFVAVATDLGEGKIHAFKSGPIAPAVNASSALSPFFRAVKLYGKVYVDGGFIDPVPVDVAQSFHPVLIIAVTLNPPLNKEMPEYSSSIFIRSLDMMLLQLNEQTARRAQVIIRPTLPEGSVFDGSKRDQSLQSGEDAAILALPKIKKLLAQHHIELSA